MGSYWLALVVLSVVLASTTVLAISKVPVNSKSPERSNNDAGLRGGITYIQHTYEVATLQLVIGSTKNQICYGVFISRKHILTLALCVYTEYKYGDPRVPDPSRPPPPIIRIRYGFHNAFFSGGYLTYATQVCVDPDYAELEDGSWTGRPLALVTLDMPAYHTVDPRPIRNPEDSISIECRTTFARIDGRDWNKVHVAHLHVIHNCNSVIKHHLLHDPRYFCVFDTNPKGLEDLIYMFNGTALMCDKEIVALATPITGKIYYRLFARVDNAQDFIERCLGEISLAPTSHNVLFLLPLYFVSSCIFLV